MKIVTWNVNSLNAREQLVGMYLDAEQPDVLCIQELKLDDPAVPVGLFEERGYHVALHGQPRWNGVLIAARSPISDVQKGLEGGDEGQSRLIAGTIDGVRIVNLYCPQGQSADSPKFQYKLRFYAALRRWLAEAHRADEPLVVLGDLNVAPEARDVWDTAAFEGVPTFHPLEHEEWAALLQSVGLHDAVKARVPPHTFSFWDYRGGAFFRGQGMRIDHILVTEPLLPRVASARILRDWRKKREGLTASDHAPVEVVLS